MLWFHGIVLPLYIDGYHDFDYKAKTSLEIWQQISKKLNLLKEHFQQIITKRFSDISTTDNDQCNFNTQNSEEEAQDYYNLVSLLESDELKFQFNQELDEKSFTNQIKIQQVHKVCYICLHLCIQSTQSELYISYITELDQSRQEVLMRLLERMGVQSSGGNSHFQGLDSRGNSLQSSPNQRYTKFTIEEEISHGSASSTQLRMAGGNGLNLNLYSCNNNIQFESTNLDSQALRGSSKNLFTSSTIKRRDAVSSSKDYLVIEKIQELEGDKKQLQFENEQLKLNNSDIQRQLDEANSRYEFTNTEKKKLHDQLLHYEIMETEYKALEKELKYLKQEKDSQLLDLKTKLSEKQDEIDMLKDQLLKKEGLEGKIDDYKNKLEVLKDAVEIKNQTLLQMKDLELQLKESQNQVQQVMKLNHLFKEEVSREKDARVSKDMLIKKQEQDIERIKEENDRFSLQLEKKDEQLRTQNREIHSLQNNMELLKEQMKSSQTSDQAFQSLSNNNSLQPLQKANTLEVLVLEMKEKIFQLQQENNMLKQEEEKNLQMKQINFRLQELGNENENLVESQHQLQRKIKNYDDKTEALKVENVQLKEKYNNLIEKEKRSQEELFQNKIDKITLAQKIELSEKQTEEFKSKIDSHNFQIRQLENDKSLLECQLQNCKDQLLEVKQIAKEKEQEIRQLNIQLTELKHENETLTRELNTFRDRSNQVKSKYSTLKQTQSDFMSQHEKLKLDHHQLVMSVQLKSQENQTLTLQLEKIEKHFKDQMAQEMKKMIQQNREKEKMKRQLDHFHAMKKESEEEGKAESQKYIENIKTFGDRLEKLKTQLQQNDQQTPIQSDDKQNFIGGAVGDSQSRNKLNHVVPSIIKTMKSRGIAESSSNLKTGQTLVGYNKQSITSRNQSTSNTNKIFKTYNMITSRKNQDKNQIIFDNNNNAQIQNTSNNIENSGNQ
eukprot:403343141